MHERTSIADISLIDILGRLSPDHVRIRPGTANIFPDFVDDQEIDFVDRQSRKTFFRQCQKRGSLIEKP